MKCPIPDNETRRLEAVRSYEVLDSVPEVDFDALTRLASHSLGVPVAAVGLMDSDRLWFKSRLGLDVPQLDRQIAFCAYTVMQPDELLVVEDLRLDSRFEDNPLVLQPPHIRFYAGAPIVDHKGLVLGTLVVADTAPRSFAKKDEAILRDLSALAMRALDNRRQLFNLAKLAMTDYLTGLANRAQFERTLEAEIAHARRTGGTLTVLYMDLDGFKGINDRLGHPTGDEVLCEVGRRLQDLVRTEDLASRLGGDEFGIVMRNASGELAWLLAQRISDAISEPITLFSGEQVGVGISIGMASYSERFDTLAVLLSEADAALYRAKRLANSNTHGE